MFIRFVFRVCVMMAMVSPATAEVVDYCAAYARDHADKGAREKMIWQRRYDNALQACNEQYSLKEPVAKAKIVKKPAAKVVASKPKTVSKAQVAVTAETPGAKKIAAIPRLEPGSPEWTNYCKNKYVSFDAAKGTYLSKTGIERKCLVTAD